MNHTQRPSIVVGVTGAGSETAALRYAAGSAVRDGSEVVLTHAYHAFLPPPPPSVLMTAERDWERLAHAIARGAREELDAITGGSVPSRVEVRAARPARALLELARDARLVVLQHREPGLLGGVFVGSTTNAVAAHATCPTVSVTRGWSPDRAPREVVVGIHGDGTPLASLEHAFGEAAALGARLRVVHAWRLDPAYDDIISDRVSEEWRVEHREHLLRLVEKLQPEFPGVDVDVEVHHQWPAQALVDLSREAGLIVIGRHGRHRWVPGHLGSTARTVLREAHCPVMVVPVGEEPDER
jgi:nucleotide-binding universal stress UspA family protein